MAELADPPPSQDNDFQYILPPRKHLLSVVRGLIVIGASVILWGFAFFMGTDYLATGSPWHRQGLEIFIVFAGIGAILVLIALHTWRLRNEPLVVASNGRVCYRNKELIAGGTAREIVVRCKIDESDGGSRSYHVIVQRCDDSEVDLLPFFSAFEGRNDAQSFGCLLAEALRISVREERPPEAAAAITTTSAP
jgi:hypothetical protein